MTDASSRSGSGRTPVLDTLTEQDIAGLSQAGDEPDWLRDQRLEAFKTWLDQEWPKERGEELWRDTPFSRFAIDVPLVTDGPGTVAPQDARSRPVGSPLLGVAELAARVDLRDGAADVTLTVAAREAGVVVSDLRTAAVEHEGLVREHLGRQTGDHDRTVTTADAAWTHGAFVYIPPELELDAPIGISVQVARPGAQLPRVLAVADRHSRSKIYVEHVSEELDDASTVDEVIEVVALDASHVDLVTLQDWRGPVGHLSLQAMELHKDAELRHLAVTIGGETVRLRPEVHLVGAGSRIEPLGVYFSDEGQHFEHHPFIEHIAGHAISEVLYKGALQGRSRTVFRGHIFVHKDAVGTDTDETNKSLILSEGAKADSTPFLEIECSEVTAGHGSATGQVDEDQLFYLESRGVSPEDALRLVVFGFFADVLDRIDLPHVKERTMQHIEAEVDRADLSSLARRGRGRSVRQPDEAA